MQGRADQATIPGKVGAGEIGAGEVGEGQGTRRPGRRRSWESGQYGRQGGSGAGGGRQGQGGRAHPDANRHGHDGIILGRERGVVGVNNGGDRMGRTKTFSVDAALDQAMELAARLWIPRRMRRSAARHVPRKRRSAGSPVTTATVTRGTGRRFWRTESGSIERRLKPSRRNSGSAPTSRRQGRSFFRDEKCRHWKSGVARAWQINQISGGGNSVTEAPAASRPGG